MFNLLCGRIAAGLLASRLLLLDAIIARCRDEQVRAYHRETSEETKITSRGMQASNESNNVVMGAAPLSRRFKRRRRDPREAAPGDDSE